MTIPLNLVSTYPVRWSRYKVFRDFIQNFYDSVGPEQWAESMHYAFEGDTLELWIDGTTFSYEWLMHIGASTKTNSSDSTAGYFGEGFKIASLCAVRDHNWKVSMESGSWHLDVKLQPDTIDDVPVEMLAYDIQDVAHRDQSRLTLRGITSRDRATFSDALTSFYYPENPLMGDLIYKDARCAVYKLGDGSYPDSAPSTREFGTKGAVFCGYQLLGSNPFGLVVCLHQWRKEDRERNGLYSFDVVDVMKTIARKVDPDAAIKILEKMRRNWNSKMEKLVDIHSWSPVVSHLVYNISQSESATRAFRTKYPFLLPAERVRTVEERNRREEAKAWLANASEDYLVVQPRFTDLGYPTLEEACEAAGGFVQNGMPTEKEGEGFALLEELTGAIYADFFDCSAFPNRRTICNEKAAYHGMARVFRKKPPKKNGFAVPIKNTISDLYLKRSIFAKDRFYDAVSTYVHEMCHVFGGDASQGFSLALTLAMEILLANAPIIEVFRKRWNELFAEA